MNDKAARGSIQIYENSRRASIINSSCGEYRVEGLLVIVIIMGKDGAEKGTETSRSSSRLRKGRVINHLKILLATAPYRAEEVLFPAMP
jgi:hypothetical protein